MDARVNEKFKEYYNLKGFYLKIILSKKQISFISYNSNLLDGIRYDTELNDEEIKKNDKIKKFTIPGLYEIIIKKINENKFTISGDDNCVNLTIFDGSTFNAKRDLEIFLIKNYLHCNNEYENMLSNIVSNLREENKIMRNEINEIKNILSKMIGGKELFNYSKKNSNHEVKLRGRPSSNNQNDIPNLNKTKNIISNDNKNNYNTNPEIFANNTNDNNKDSSPKPFIKIKNKSHNQVGNSLTISSLANLEYGLYPPVELSQHSFNNISGYGANSYNGIVRNYNEDRIKVILDYKLRKTIHSANGNIIYPNISYFGIYDGHGGNKCSNFLQEKLHTLLFESEYFPLYTLQAIYESYLKAEQEFQAMAFDSQKNILLDKSGSCSISILIINEWCFVTYLGDSRALYSFDSGNQLFQISRDHKPNDPIERNRIEKAGGNVFKDDRVKINGQKVHVKEEVLGPGVSFPYRVSPGSLAVSY